MVTKYNYSLLKHNTFGLDVTCASYHLYESRAELKQLYAESLFSDNWYVIGGGSNLLLTCDLSYPVVQSGMKGIELLSENDEQVVVRAEAGLVWDEFVAYTVQQGWYGVENLSYIPGTVGASPVQNVGAYGVEAKDVISRVEVFDTRTGRFSYLEPLQCQWGYRDSVFKREKHYIVVSVEFLLRKRAELRLDYGNVREVVDRSGDYTIQGVRDAIVSIRKSKLPEVGEIGSAGSFFKNPVVDASVFAAIKQDYPDVPYYALEDEMYKIPAAWMISQCGWKGKSCGGAGVYEKQPLILVNRGNATASDILRLMEQIQDSVNEKFHVTLHPEVCVVS